MGEYIGNVHHQHLVSYPRETIIFYSIVDNYSQEVCFLPEESFRIFKQFDLDVVSIARVGLYKDYDRLCDDLCSEYKEVQSLSIQAREEGEVLYFVKRVKGKGKNDRVLGLCKLKTLEYRLFRKIREKMRNFIESKTKLNAD